MTRTSITAKITAKASILILFFLAVGTISSGTAWAAPDLKIGIFLPERTPQAISNHQSQVGRHQDIVMFYQAWGSYGGGLDTERIQWIIDNGSIPMITWEPWVWGGDRTNQPDYRLSKISGGNHDAYIREFAQSVKQVGGVVYLRPMHEMNGDWYPWAGTVNGNSPNQYVPAYRHIVDIFRQEGVANVRWVWSPNNAGLPDWGTSSFKTYYPGDSYVDFAAVDGYNFGASQSWSQWASFESIFDQAYKTITGLTQKPIIVAEMSSAEQGGSKADWIRSAYAALKSSYPKISAVIWFNESGDGTDWRIHSSADSLAAYKEALSAAPAPPQPPAPDTIPPNGRIVIDGGASRTPFRKVTLDMQGNDSGGSGLRSMRLANAPGAWGPWQAFAPSVNNWALPSGAGVKTVYMQLKDGAGNVSSVVQDDIVFGRAVKIKLGGATVLSKAPRRSRFAVTWQALRPATGSWTYKVKYRPGRSGKWRVLRKATANTSLTFKGRRGRTYYFKVKAQDEARNSLVSAVKKAVVR